MRLYCIQHLMKKGAMYLKENKKRYMGGFGGEKGTRKWCETLL